MKYYALGEMFEDYSVSAFLLYIAVEVKKEAWGKVSQLHLSITIPIALSPIYVV